MVYTQILSFGAALGSLAFIVGCGNDESPMLSKTSDASDTVVRSTSKTETDPAPQPGTATWPHWRGPHNDGISREKIDGDALNGMPPITWRHNIGIGYSTVSVADSRLYTMGHPEGTDHETVWCLDAESGKVHWSLTYPCPLLDHLHKGGPGATPTIDGNAVYVNSREGEVRRIDATTGNVAWVVDLGDLLEIPLPEWGFTCSVIVRGEELILEAGRVIGLNKETGELKWKTEAHMPGYGTPEVFEFDGKPYLAALNNEGVSLVDLEKKEEIAFYEWESPYDTNSTTPLWHKGQLFVSTGYNIGCGLLDFDGQELTLDWQNKNMRNHMNSCVLKDGWLYGFDGNSHNRRTVTLKCVNWKTGELSWTERDLGCGALVATQEHLIILSDEGELLLADLDPQSFKERGRLKVLDEQCWTMPVLCNGYVYCRGAEGSLACVDLDTVRAAE